MDYKSLPLSQILREREIYVIFDEEFQRATWLDLSALQNSESTMEDLYTDKIVPKDVLDIIDQRIQNEIKFSE
ncbi:MAG: hypothetical protein K5675_06940 [Lachnospiraceae bacterium]|nr:hypothetical protein [Lachnospiraceae bacterium]